MTAYIFQCQIGKSASDEFSEKQKEFYSWLINNIGSIQGEIEYRFFRTIPISNEIIQHSPGKTYDLISDSLAKATIEYPVTAPNSILIIDIDIRKSGQLRGKSYTLLLSAINHWSSEHLNIKTIMLLVDSLPQPKDIVQVELDQIKKNKNLLIIDENGQSIPNELIPQTEFCKRQIEADNNPRLALKKKMVRNIGHFQKGREGTSLCVRHFYDGSYCVSDIANILYIELIDQIKRGDIVCYHASRSPWVKQSLTELQNKTCCTIKDITEIEKNCELTDYHVILDFIDTGKTFLETLDKLNKLPKRIISILAKPSENDVKGIKTVITSDGSKLNIEYLLKADYVQLGIENKSCPLCEIGIPKDTLDKPSIYGALRAQDFWEMVFLNCNTQELNPPPHRDKETVTINLSKALANNGAFIASRVRQILKFLELSSDCVLLYPENEHVSQKFALNLFYLSSENHIQIPRKAIDEAELKGKIDHNHYTNEEWHNEFYSKSIQDCIIIDDILVTGKTMKGIENIVNQFGKTIIAYIPILQFGDNNIQIDQHKTIPLYYLDIYTIQQ